MQMTKVEDLLRKSQTNAFQMNKDDLDKKYNLKVTGLDSSSVSDRNP